MSLFVRLTITTVSYQMNFVLILLLATLLTLQLLTQKFFKTKVHFRHIQFSS
jgi:hypothetical protein